MSSQPPVSRASCGMSPSFWLWGRRRTPFGMAVSWHDVSALASVTSRRHLPTCTTTGTPVVAGTPVILNFPSTSVTASAM